MARVISPCPSCICLKGVSNPSGFEERDGRNWGGTEVTSIDVDQGFVNTGFFFFFFFLNPVSHNRNYGNTEFCRPGGNISEY